MSLYTTIATLFAQRGDAAYFGEPVSNAEHNLQAAALAETEGAPDALVIAALLHDIGHLLHHETEDIAERGVDMAHEAIGDGFLTRHFPPSVTEPARLHVAAKRYLCATDPTYAAALSPASVTSLALQGGPMDTAERAAFEANPFHADAVRLRRWDDAAKIPGLPVPPLGHYAARIEALGRDA
jgi:gamma-butyrobetaine dioxygenase